MEDRKMVLFFIVGLLLFLGGTGLGAFLDAAFRKKDTSVEEVLENQRATIEAVVSPTLEKIRGAVQVNDKLASQPAACLVLVDHPELADDDLRIDCALATCWRTKVAEGGRAECDKVVDLWVKARTAGIEAR